MNEVVSLKPSKVTFAEQVNEETVRTLETWLEKAKQGKLDGIAIAGALRNGEIMTAYTPTDNSHQITAALAILQHRRLETRTPAEGWED